MPQKPNNTSIFLKDLIIATFSASVPKTLSAPIQFVKLRLTVVDNMIRQGTLQKPYNGFVDCAIRVAKEQGIITLWKGNGKNLVRFLPNQALNFALKDFFHRFFAIKAQINEYLMTIFSNFITGGAAGFISLSFVYSLDTSRIKLFNDSKKAKRGEPRQFDGIIDVYKKTLKSQGIAGLYRGFAIMVIGIVVYRSIYFGLFDSFRMMFPQSWKNSLLANFFLGWFTTVCAYLGSSPIEELRKRMMFRVNESGEYPKLVDFVRKEAAKDGWVSMCRIYGKIYFITRGFAGGIMLSLYERLQYMVYEEEVN